MSASNPVRHWPAVTLFLFLICLSSIVGGLMCLPASGQITTLLAEHVPQQVLSARHYIMQGFIIVMSFGLTAFAVADSRSMFPGLTLLLILLASPFLAYILVRQTEVIFLVISLSFAVLVVVFSTYGHIADDLFSVAIQVCFLAWSALALFVRASEYLGLYYKGSAEYPAPLWFLVSSRTAVGVAGICLLLTGGVREVLREEIASVPSLPAVVIRRGEPLTPLRALVIPFIYASRFILAIVTKFVDVAWKLLAYTALYLISLAFGVIKVAVNTLANIGMWLRMLRCAAACVLVILFALYLDKVTNTMINYLYASESLGLRAQWPSLSPAILGYLVIFVGVFTVALLLAGWSKWSDVSSKVGFGGATILMALFASAIPLYTLRKAKLITVYGFDKFGLFFVALSGILVLLLVGEGLRWPFHKSGTNSQKGDV